MATHSLQKFCLVEGLWHFLQYLRPQLLHVVRDAAGLLQTSQVSFFLVMIRSSWSFELLYISTEKPEKSTNKLSENL